jgi:hypothetical protein
MLTTTEWVIKPQPSSRKPAKHKKSKSTKNNEKTPGARPKNKEPMAQEGAKNQANGKVYGY